MIPPDARRGVLTVAFFFVILPLLLLSGARSGTASFVITIATAAIGLIFTILVLATITWSSRRVGEEERSRNE